MKKFNQELIKQIVTRFLHLPSTYLGMIVIFIGFLFILLGKITITEFTAFIAVAFPFFFYKKKDENNENK